MADNVTTEELETALQQLADGMGLSVKEYVESLGYETVAQVTSKVAGVQAQIDAITELDASDGAVSLAEQIKSIEAVLSNEDGVVQQIFTTIQGNSNAILTEKSRAEDIEAGLRTDTDTAIAKGNSNTTAITNLDARVVANRQASESRDTALSDRVSPLESAIALLNNPDLTVEGSIAYAVEQEAIRAKAAALTLKTTLEGSIETAKDEAVQSVKDYADATFAPVVAKSNANESALNTLNGDVTTDGSVAKQINDAKVSLQSSITLNEDAIAKLNAGSGVTGSVDEKIATALADLGQGNLTDMTDKITDLENTVNDTTDTDGNLVKGVATMTAENTTAIAQEKANRMAETAQTILDMKAYSDSKDLKASSMDICSIGNKFRFALGLADTDCSGSSNNGDGEAI